jgi:hypothetical protein
MYGTLGLPPLHSPPCLLYQQTQRQDDSIIRPTPFPNDTVFISDAYTSNKLVTKLMGRGGGQHRFHSVQCPGDSDPDRIKLSLKTILEDMLTQRNALILFGP